MSYRYKCPYCGANLDPGERCDCRNEQEENDAENKEAAMPASTAAIPQENGELNNEIIS